ncbi:phosphatase PAP2 family protein [Chlorobaculum sp. 24CR]|uniref:phosphatase PAP2 family protein n=1 Tax=Chlorobaculum sp. 24CR TaxID=2508878 RepID=UPI00100B5959|nr:phosphatase PAP2 family protein [Chlorobaculum sp. 24CR]RXK87680.1 phosphatase PAP2 family protein [Chlorobaculum sp. 24CR]
MGGLEQADAWLFQLLNHGLVRPELDDLMLMLTSPKLSFHLFVLFGLFIFVRKGKDALYVVPLILLAIGLADYTASGIFKPLFQRVRPCFALDGVRLLVDQTRSWSFASSHAANSTVIASLVWLFFWKGETVDKAFAVVVIFYAAMVAFSRIYIGVHYPGDVLGGIVIGLACAAVIYTAFAWFVKNFIHQRAMRTGGAE